MKKAITILFAVALLLFMTACGSGNKGNNSQSENLSTQNQGTEQQTQAQGGAEQIQSDIIAEPTPEPTPTSPPKEIIEQELQGAWLGILETDEGNIESLFIFDTGHVSSQAKIPSGVGETKQGNYEIGNGIINLIYNNGIKGDVTYIFENETLSLFIAEGVIELKRTEMPEPIQELTADELDVLLKEQPLIILKTNYLVQHDRHKTLYPDMLQAILQNNSTDDIKDATIAFVAWDENGLPVKIKSNSIRSNTAYIMEVNFGDINLVPQKAFGDNNGFAIDESNNIKTFKAIVVSYETFEGVKWYNPYYDTFRTLYEGAKHR